jgi:hypothetical protein
MLLRSKYLGMGWFGPEHNIQGALCPRGATSKNFPSGIHRAGTRKRDNVAPSVSVITFACCGVGVVPDLLMM